MPKRKVKPALISVTKKGRSGEKKYRLTDLGLEVVRELALIKCPESEIAAHLGIAMPAFRKMLDETSDSYDPDLEDAIAEGHGEFKKMLRQRQIDLAETNAQMAIHLGRVFLDQHDKSQVEHTHRHAVVGTLPDYNSTSDDWKRKYAPEGVLKIEEQRRIEMGDIEDAEVVEVRREESSEK